MAADVGLREVAASACRFGKTSIMSEALPLPDMHDEAAETEALGCAVGEARKDRRGSSHSEVPEWLLCIAACDFSAKLPPLRGL